MGKKDLLRLFSNTRISQKQATEQVEETVDNAAARGNPVAKKIQRNMAKDALKKPSRKERRD